MHFRFRKFSVETDCVAARLKPKLRATHHVFVEAFVGFDFVFLHILKFKMLAEGAGVEPANGCRRLHLSGVLHYQFCHPS